MESKGRLGARALCNVTDTTGRRGFLGRGAGPKAHPIWKRVSSISEDILILVLYKNLVCESVFLSRKFSNVFVVLFTITQ